MDALIAMDERQSQVLNELAKRMRVIPWNRADRWGFKALFIMMALNLACTILILITK